MKRTGKRIKRVFLLGGKLMALIVLVAVAFFAPQVIFQAQDYFLCTNTNLSKREAMDVETLSTTYERSLKQRMQNFADGFGAGENYYVAAQDFEISQELYDFLSDVMYQDIVLFYVDAGFIPIEFYQSECTVNQWKRYVVYSDDYTKGVNFILWYVEMQDKTGMVMKLLIDGEDGTIYALKTEPNEYLARKETSVHEISGAFTNINDIKYIVYDDYLAGVWANCAIYYEALFKSEANRYIADALAGDENLLWESEWHEYDGAGCALRFFLPYGHINLEFAVDIGEFDLGLKYVIYRYPDFVMGVRQIYEKIPEFT